MTDLRQQRVSVLQVCGQQSLAHCCMVVVVVIVVGHRRQAVKRRGAAAHGTCWPPETYTTNYISIRAHILESRRRSVASWSASRLFIGADVLQQRTRRCQEPVWLADGRMALSIYTRSSISERYVFENYVLHITIRVLVFGLTLLMSFCILRGLYYTSVPSPVHLITPMKMP